MAWMFHKQTEAERRMRIRPTYQPVPDRCDVLLTIARMNGWDVRGLYLFVNGMTLEVREQAATLGFLFWDQRP